MTLPSLFSAYKALEPLDRALVEILAVAHDAFARTAIGNIVKLLGFQRTAGGRALSNDQVLDRLGVLVAARVIEVIGSSYRCDRQLADAVVDVLAREGRLAVVAAALTRVLGPSHGLRGVREALFLGDSARATELYRQLALGSYWPLVSLVEGPLEASWLRLWPEPLLARALSGLAERSLVDLSSNESCLSALEVFCAERERAPELRALLAVALSLGGRAPEASRWLRGPETSATLAASAWLAFVGGDAAATRASFERLQASKTPADDLVTRLAFVAGLLSLQGRGESAAALRVRASIRTASEPGWWAKCLDLVMLPATLAVGLGDREHELKERLDAVWFYRETPLAKALRLVARGWVGVLSDQDAAEAQTLATSARKAGLLWVSGELDAVRARSKGEAGVSRLLDAIPRQEPWMRALDALERLATRPADKPTPAARERTTESVRLAWFIELRGTQGDLRPAEQKRDAKGQWSQGRRVALKRLHEASDEMAHLSAQDRRALASLEATTYRPRGYPETTYAFRAGPALRSLLGHPAVYLEGDPPAHVDLVEGTPTLTVVQEGDWVRFQLSPPLVRGQEVALERESAARLKVVFPSEGVQRYAEVIGAGLRVPRAEQGRVAKLLGPLSSVLSVQSTLGGGGAPHEKKKASSAPIVQLWRRGEGLLLRLIVRPFSTPEPCFTPGVGAETVLAEIEGQRWQTQRSLAQETLEATALREACPSLARWSGAEGQWSCSSASDALEFLLELGRVEGARVEWPGGRALRVREPLDRGHLSLRVSTEPDGFFRATGDLCLGKKESLELGRLLDLLGASPGRFVRLDEDDFVALTQEFFQQLGDLRDLSERRGKTVRFPLVAGLALDGWLEPGGHVRGDASWQRHVECLQEAQHLDPEVPPTLRAELRPYQLEGYRWLCRLAHWGAGACLADDMGLGKTVQALALLVQRATGGPALVVAPTSLGLNWIEEARRFAPTLRCLWLASADRATALAEVGPFDVVVTSYALLVQEAERLTAVRWSTVVLDEAQAIKNATARRSTAAVGLRADFRLATTGTPIENNLGELWSLFRFLNPGLLGTQESFTERFAVPIEKNRDRVTGARLRRLLQPFLLRRTKSQVLTELPSRSEVLLAVELSAEEAALYEALRRTAVAGLEGKRAGHIDVLAAITRLRRACCHPRLVLPESALSSAKLTAFGELVQELRGSGHRALVFSQFVDHLTLVRAHLDEQEVRYQYLDGSTPAAERKRRVEAFQAGEGELFLISLRAGGLGLNLTAADSVIHLDPWWNPAVEDQATDRAHRIGQTRPVTVYRIITRHTIESRILDLHDRKRDLANRLLEGTDVSGSLSVEELMQLLRADA
jgi:superfamily II DNA or RNA helicase